MNSQPRLHIARATPALKDPFNALLETLEQGALLIPIGGPLTAATAWELAQFIDLADAGYGSKKTMIYRTTKIRLTAFVESNFQNPAIRSLCGRSAILSQLVNEVLASCEKRRSVPPAPIAWAA